MFQSVLEKQSYMLIGRHDIEKLMRFDPASACFPNSLSQSNMVNHASDAESVAIELELSELLLNLRPIKQVCVILWPICVAVFKVLSLFLSFVFFSCLTMKILVC